MKISVRKVGTVNVLDCQGRMSIGEGDAALRTTTRDLLQTGERKFLLNMLEVPYMDSSGLGELVASYKRIAEKGGTIKLVLNPRGEELMALPKLHLVFEIFGDLESALASFPG